MAATRQQILNLLNNPAIITPNDLAPNIPQGRQGDGLNYLYEILRLMNGAIFANPISNPKNRIYLTKNPDDKYGGDLQTAIDAAVSPSPSNSPKLRYTWGRYK